MLAIEYYVHIWQVLPQLSCGGTCHIWMWFKECNWYFCEIENFAYGEIDERSFSNPHPSSVNSQAGSVQKPMYPPMNRPFMLWFGFPIFKVGRPYEEPTWWLTCVISCHRHPHDKPCGTYLQYTVNTRCWHQGLYSLRRILISIGIPIINLRRSSDRLRFIMGIPTPVRRRLLSE